MQTSRKLFGTDDVKHWLVHGKPGSRIVYYTGFLATDLAIRPDTMRGHAVKSEVIATAKLLREAARLEKVHLFQKRVGPGTFEYIAERRHVDRPHFEYKMGEGTFRVIPKIYGNNFGALGRQFKRSMI